MRPRRHRLRVSREADPTPRQRDKDQLEALVDSVVRAGRGSGKSEFNAPPLEEQVECAPPRRRREAHLLLFLEGPLGEIEGTVCG